MDASNNPQAQAHSGEWPALPARDSSPSHPHPETVEERWTRTPAGNRAGRVRIGTRDRRRRVLPRPGDWGHEVRATRPELGTQCASGDTGSFCWLHTRAAVCGHSAGSDAMLLSGWALLHEGRSHDSCFASPDTIPSCSNPVEQCNLTLARATSVPASAMTRSTSIRLRAYRISGSSAGCGERSQGWRASSLPFTMGK
jgi:hypothetical protein